MPHAKPSLFAKQLLAWFDVHGRKHLPWQEPITPYRVWLSEIMLQQTQVDTVIPYFERFLATFPTIEDLAKAKIDDVLHLWTGLGYYARARNLHRCAKSVVDQYGGQFPSDVEKLSALPGIGPSTAAAIASIAFEQATAILDGNVKRVLARYYGIEGWPGVKSVEQALWSKARQNMPNQRCRDYTQAIMDLGATVCKRSKPECTTCPVKNKCVARKEQRIAQLPGKKPRKAIPTKTTTMLIMQRPDGCVLLEQRPASGIWGGLWSLPEAEDSEAAITERAQDFGSIKTTHCLPTLRHVFSHFNLDIAPVHITLGKTKQQVKEQGYIWYNLQSPQAVGLAAPIKKLLNQLDSL